MICNGHILVGTNGENGEPAEFSEHYSDAEDWSTAATAKRDRSPFVTRAAPHPRAPRRERSDHPCNDRADSRAYLKLIDRRGRMENRLIFRGRGAGDAAILVDFQNHKTHKNAAAMV